ncbi:MAG: ROK family transcriptional regulator [Chloroflexi bacterium]|nr:ROK family transcriptional regulator [Chloroflexota bacterium]
MKQTLTSTLMRSINRSAILNLIRLNSPITRAQISRELDISLPTVMRIVEILVDEDLVRYVGNNESSGGRPASLLEFNGQAYAVVGIDLGGSKMYGAVADLSGNIQYEISIPTNSIGVDHSLELLIDLIEKLLDAPRPAGQIIRGIGLGLPGVTLSREGIVTWVPSLGWRDLPIRDILKERFGYSVFTENDVNLIALGELNFGAGKGVHNLVCIAVGTGIGAGIIINQALYRGFNQASGEIGYLLPDVAALGIDYDEFGAMENLASGPGIARRAREYFVANNLPLPDGELTAEDVFIAARDGKIWAQNIAQGTIDLLSMAIANISALINPEIVILSGGVIRSADLLIEPIRQRIRGTIPYLPKIEASQLGSRAAVLGAIILVLNGTSEQYVVERVY